MDFFDEPVNVITFCCWLMTLIIDAHQCAHIAEEAERPNVVDDSQPLALQWPEAPVMDSLAIVSNTLYNYRVCLAPYPLTDEIGYWVKPCSTTWFSRYLLQEYDNSRWLSMFRMTKQSVFSLAELLKPHVYKKNTRYRLTVPILIRVACTLFKLTHGANLTVCSEMFAIGRNTVCKILRDVVHAINDTLKHEVCWPSSEKL